MTPTTKSERERFKTYLNAIRIGPATVREEWITQYYLCLIADVERLEGECEQLRARLRTEQSNDRDPVQRAMDAEGYA